MHGSAAEKAMCEKRLDEAQNIPQGKKVLDSIRKPMDVHLSILPDGAFSRYQPKSGKVTVNIAQCSPEMLIVILHGMLMRQNTAQEAPRPTP
ncbi:MAG TPA: hypothetical protein DCW68_04365 [Rhodospirillaceae bacterium]|nr:MAG: hypothetical protein A2018_03285 [Alphaproteobacteria bacterium GWF2_58_20]HAU29330.1 hypothetical protein [Rhodospirillaceae bacterium]